MHALVRIATDAGYEFDLLRAVISANEQQFERIAAKAQRLLEGDMAGKNIALLGLTFKAHTDDLRNSPAIEVARRLAQKGAILRAYDPMVNTTSDTPNEIEIAATIENAVEQADLAVVLTEWPEFASADWPALADLMRSPRLVDARNLLDRDSMIELGFRYDDLGRT
jgi:UDPglucose 6-dehydrogenase